MTLELLFTVIDLTKLLAQIQNNAFGLTIRAAKSSAGQGNQKTAIM